VLVAADYRMKRIGMKLEASPVAGLPSYLDMISAAGSGMQSMTPRWWLVANYEPLVTDAQGLALGDSRPQRQDDDGRHVLQYRRKQGPRGQVEPCRSKWADMMTSKYEQLAQKEPIFAQLKNCMDLAVIAALIKQGANCLRSPATVSRS